MLSFVSRQYRLNQVGRTSFCRHFRSSVILNEKIHFKLADIGEGIAEVEVLQWFVKPGDKVAQFDKICEVQSDKATVEISSRFDGVIEKLNWNIGDMAKVGSTLVEMDVEDSSSGNRKSKKKETVQEDAVPEHVPDAAPEPVRSVGVDAPRSVEKLGSFSIDPMLRPPSDTVDNFPARSIEDHNAKILTTPSVRRLAKDHGLDLLEVQAKLGVGSRLTKGDVLNYLAMVPLEERKKQAEQKLRESSVRMETQPSTIPDAGQEPQVVVPKKPSVLEADQVVPIKGIQRIMVKSMTESLKIPHFQYKDEFEMNKLADLRKDLKAEAEQQGLKLSYMPLLIKACSLALLEFPMLNAHVNAEVTEVVHKKDHNISVAMDTPRGLLVPVITRVQERSIFDISRELLRLQALGNENKLGETELTGATFTLSNIGSIGGTYASPVLPAPTVCIGAIGKIQTLPRFIDENDYEKGVYPSKLMSVSWGADHRVVDGATMARFSNKMKKYVEVPQAMFAAMV